MASENLKYKHIESFFKFVEVQNEKDDGSKNLLSKNCGALERKLFRHEAEHCRT